MVFWDVDQVDRFENGAAAGGGGGGGDPNCLSGGQNPHYKIAGLELLRNHYPKMYEPHIGPYGDRSATTSKLKWTKS
jgi:hypothetical protein